MKTRLPIRPEYGRIVAYQQVGSYWDNSKHEMPLGPCPDDKLTDYLAFFGKRKIVSGEAVDPTENLLCLNDETAYVQGDWNNANFASIWIETEHCE